VLQESVARRYNFKGPFDPDLIDIMQDPIRREFVMRSFKLKTAEEIILEVLTERYPEMLKALFNAHGTVLARVGGAKIERIFEETEDRRSDGVKQIYRLPDGEIVGVVD